MATSVSTGTEPRPEGADLGRYPWIAMAVVLTGSYMVVLDTTVLGVALAQIAEDLQTSSAFGVDWVVTAYLVAVGITQPATGWMADRWGKKHLYVAALLFFTLGSGLSTVAPTLWTLIGARVVQGLGGGAMMPVGMAMIYELFPPNRRGTALGIWGVAIMAAPALGPPVGGWLVTNASWRWIFFVNLPIGALALFLAVRLLRDIGFREERPLDIRGWMLASIGIVGIVIVSRQASDWGWGSPVTLLLFAAGIAVLAWLVRRSLRHAHPIIDFRMFAVPTFSLTIALVALMIITQFARLTFLPVELQVVRGLTAQEVGLILAPGAIGVATTMPLGGWLADRIGSRVPVAVGVLVMTGSTWFIAHLRPDTPKSHLVAILVVSGVGTGLAIMPSTVAAMNALPTRFVAQAAAVRSLNQRVAAALGTAALAAFIAAQLGVVAPESLDAAGRVEAQDVYNQVFLIATGILVAVFVLALFLPGRKRMRQFQEYRADEHREVLGSVEAT